MTDKVTDLSDARRRKAGIPPRSKWDAWLDTPRETWKHEYGPWMWKNAPWAKDVKSGEFAVSLENVCSDMATHGDEEPTLAFAVSEAKYVLQTLGEFFTTEEDENDPDKQAWLQEEIKHLKAFIDKYEKYITN